MTLFRGFIPARREILVPPEKRGESENTEPMEAVLEGGLLFVETRIGVCVEDRGPKERLSQSVSFSEGACASELICGCTAISMV